MAQTDGNEVLQKTVVEGLFERGGDYFEFN